MKGMGKDSGQGEGAVSQIFRHLCQGDVFLGEMSGHVNDDIIDNIMPRLFRSFLKRKTGEGSCQDNLGKCLAEDRCCRLFLRVRALTGRFVQPAQGVRNIRMNGFGGYDRIFRLPCQELIRVCACKGGRRQKVEGPGLFTAEYLIVVDDVRENNAEVSGLHVEKSFADAQLQRSIVAQLSRQKSKIFIMN